MPNKLFYVQIVVILGSVVLFGVVIDFIRRGLLKEKYSLLWLALCLVVAVLAIYRRLLDVIALELGVSYAPSLLFLVAFLFVLLILLHFSVVISILHEKNKSLAQEIALLHRMIKDGRPATTEAGAKAQE